MILLLSAPVLGNAPKRSKEYFQSHNDLKLTIEFALTFEEAKEIILRHYPDLKSDEEIRRFIVDRDIQRHVVEGVEMYFASFEHNLYTRYPELVKREPGWSATNTLLVKNLLSEYALRQTPFANFRSSFSPYFNPKEYLVEYTLQIERSLLRKRAL